MNWYKIAKQKDQKPATPQELFRGDESPIDIERISFFNVINFLKSHSLTWSASMKGQPPKYWLMFNRYNVDDCFLSYFAYPLYNGVDDVIFLLLWKKWHNGNTI